MATKKPSSKKSVKKSANTPKRSAKKNKSKAPEIINIEENKELQPEAVVVVENNIQQPTETNNPTQNMPIETPQTNIVPQPEQTEDTSSLAPQAAAVNKEEIVVENASYSNLGVPQTKDNTYTFIIGGIVAIVIFTLMFL